MSVKKKLVLHFLRHMIGLKYLRHFFIHSEVQPKLIVTRSHAFSRTLRQLPVIKFRVLIGSLYCLCHLWLAGVITLVLVLRHSSENRSSFSVNILKALINKMHISIQGPLSLDLNVCLHLWLHKKRTVKKNLQKNQLKKKQTI